MIATDLLAYLSDPATTLPEPLELESSGQEIVTAYKAGTGVTFSLYFGAVGKQKLYAVSVYPECSEIIAGKNLNSRLLRTFMRKYRDLLRDPRNCVGVWYDAETDLTYLDISAIVSDRAEAIRLGREYNQIGVFDFERGEIIATEGTGEEIEDLPPMEKRLPELRRDEDVGNNQSDDRSDGA